MGVLRAGMLSEAAGAASLLVWIFAQSPQLWTNYKARSVDGLSSVFLLQWALGDATSLVGAVLTEQPRIQIIIAVYMLFVDLCLCAQFWSARITRHGSNIVLLGAFAWFGLTPLAPGWGERTGGVYRSAPFGHGRGSAAPQHALPMQGPFRAASFARPLDVAAFVTQPLDAAASVARRGRAPTVSRSHMAGRISAWTGTLLYTTSRLPQIWTNFLRHSVQGLSVLLFLSAFVANLLYSVSILTNPRAQGASRVPFLRESLPFLLGSCGTLVFDLVILVQWAMWHDKQPRRERLPGRRWSADVIGP
ncbi:hypothetical protein MSPP1_001122 [Malassezia sp. CBS 17886]|nr:hypothetical protein MSPP1_001122 [Malassezia sp. CBS 17886]